MLRHAQKFYWILNDLRKLKNTQNHERKYTELQTNLDITKPKGQGKKFVKSSFRYIKKFVLPRYSAEKFVKSRYM